VFYCRLSLTTLSAVNLCFSAAQSSRGTRQLKDFMGDGRNFVDRQRSAAAHLSDGHEAVASDNSDDETAARRQPVSRAGGRRGRGRPAGPSRGRYSETRQQYGDRELAERPRYSNVRGHGPRNDSGYQQQDYGSRINARRQADDTYHPERDHGRGKQPIEDRQNYDNRQPAYTESVERQEDWSKEIVTSQSSKQTEQCQERVHTVSVRTADDNMTAKRPPHSGQRTSDSIVRSQQQEDKHMPREPPAPRRMHPTRTISNSNYQTAENIPPNRDRGNQIGGIVDAMNRISVKTASDGRQEVSSIQPNVAARSTMILSGMCYYGDWRDIHLFISNTM